MRKDGKFGTKLIRTGRIENYDITNCHGAVNTHSIANGFGGFLSEPYALDGGSQNSTHNFPGLTSWWPWSVGLLQECWITERRPINFVPMFINESGDGAQECWITERRPINFVPMFINESMEMEHPRS